MLGKESDMGSGNEMLLQTGWTPSDLTSGHIQRPALLVLARNQIFILAIFYYNLCDPYL